ncbi:DUF6527 family protein [Paraburkholderia xenovorans]
MVTTPSGSLASATPARTLAPSVDRTVGCKSHFFVRGGRIQWCQ